jgi:peptidoglycan-associated lipoprotein
MQMLIHRLLTGSSAALFLLLACSHPHRPLAAMLPPAPIRDLPPAPPTQPEPTVASKASPATTPERSNPTVAATPKPALSDLLSRMLRDAYFDYDRHDLRPDARTVLESNRTALQAILQDYPGQVLTIEGHCDERGLAEYNLALGDARAQAAREYLVRLGVPGDQLKPVSYGKERPVCTDANEDCWQKNRRAHVSER